MSVVNILHLRFLNFVNLFFFSQEYYFLINRDLEKYIFNKNETFHIL